MTSGRAFRDPALALWTALSVLALFLYAAVLRPAGDRVARVRSQNAAIVRELAENAREKDDAAILHAQAAAMRRDVLRIAGAQDDASVTALALRTLATRSERYAARVVSVQPSVVAATRTPRIDDGLSRLPLSIRARGRFPDLLAFIENLSHQKPLIGVGSAQFTVSSARPARRDPEVIATINVVVYRLTR